MDATRYYLALLTVVTIPPGILSWFVIHPFAATWRRLPSYLAYVTMLVAVVPVGVVLYMARRELMQIEFGFHWALALIAAVVYFVAAVIEIMCRRHLKMKVLVGLPEISSERGPGILLDQGIYARMRHPRYVDIVLGILAIALFTNYLAVYVLWILCLPMVWLLAWIEERELRARFGVAYQEYSERVPRFIPRPRSGSGPD